MPHFQTLVGVVVGFLVLFQGDAAYATLGRGIGSIESDQHVSSPRTVKKTSHGLYDVYEMHGRGFSFREYLSQNGAVFGMTWTGLVNLSLNDIYGPYLSDYLSAAQHKVDTQRNSKFRFRMPRLFIQGSQVTMERLGHGRHIHAKAVVKELIPAGVTLDEIR